ncbi:MAG: hypothetical protein IPN34_14965 [Planctomycetes bacterium]|nr:hypothetical protein [Planctomycetota bacterium]
MSTTSRRLSQRRFSWSAPAQPVRVPASYYLGASALGVPWAVAAVLLFMWVEFLVGSIVSRSSWKTEELLALPIYAILAALVAAFCLRGPILRVRNAAQLLVPGIGFAWLGMVAFVVAWELQLSVSYPESVGHESIYPVVLSPIIASYAFVLGLPLLWPLGIFSAALLRRMGRPRT